VFWVNPSAAFALVALAIPVLVHVLARHRAPRVAFPTLRFLSPNRMASARRRTVEDLPLLLVRLLILAAAIGAAAGPFLVTSARRKAWDSTIVSALVIAPSVPAPADGRAFVAERLPDGMARAVAWLDRQPPGRREILIRSPFPIGSIDSSDIAGVPSHVGLRFERVGALPTERTVDARPVFSERPGDRTVVETRRTLTLARDGTRVRDTESAAAAMPVEIVDDQKHPGVASAVLQSVLEERVPVPVAGRRARVVLSGGEIAANPSETIREPWIADAAAAIRRDLARDNDSTATRFSESNGQLVVSLNAQESVATTARVVRAVFAAMAPPAEIPGAEVGGISDAQLAAWSRPAGATPPPAQNNVTDDRRWLWGAVLVLLALETWMRRSGGSDSSARTRSEVARVA
jgi:hypothetical protein